MADFDFAGDLLLLTFATIPAHFLLATPQVAYLGQALRHPPGGCFDRVDRRMSVVGVGTPV